MTRFPKGLTLCVAGFGALVLLACPAGDDTATTENTETGTSGDGDGDQTGDGDGDPATGDGDGDSNLCGNGDLDDGEECDDGNQDEGDGCSASCTVTSCGLSWAVTADVPSGVAGGFDTYVGDDGSIYTTGITINDDNDLWVAKWNADGSVAWSQSFGGAGGDAGLALVVADAVYVTGYAAGDGQDIWYASLDPATGSENWSQVVAGDVMGEDDLGTGIDVDPNGDLIITGRIRAGEGDDDIWIRKASASDGSEIWTVTWTGDGDGNFSTERGGPVSAAPDGTYWVAAREHVAFDTQEATLLHVTGAGEIAAVYQPQVGGSHQHDPIDVEATDGGIYFAMQDSDFPFKSWLYKFDGGGAEQWVITHEDWFARAGEVGSEWAPRGIGIDADGTIGVGGQFNNEEEGEDINWGEAWVSKLDPSDGSSLCLGSYMVDDGNFLPPSLGIDGVGYSGGGFGVTAIETAGQGNATKMWTGHFLP